MSLVESFLLGIFLCILTLYSCICSKFISVSFLLLLSEINANNVVKKKLHFCNVEQYE